jgi:pimeloyl-ACP methyl ester carboxylesterase
VISISQGPRLTYSARLPGVFKRILPLASSHSLRVICLSRREYEGSTPYSADELKTIHHGSDAKRADFLHNEGILIALFVDGLIQSLSLPKAGGVIVAGWSLGNIFTIAMRTSINDLPDNAKQRLKAYTRGFIIFGPSLRCSSYPP